MIIAIVILSVFTLLGLINTWLLRCVWLKLVQERNEHNETIDELNKIAEEVRMLHSRLMPLQKFFGRVKR
jgi:hypothetical protein